MPTKIPRKKATKRKASPPPISATNGNLDRGESGYVKKTISLPAGLHREMRQYALDHGTNVSRVLVSAFEHWRADNP